MSNTRNDDATIDNAFPVEAEVTTITNIEADESAVTKKPRKRMASVGMAEAPADEQGSGHGLAGLSSLFKPPVAPYETPEGMKGILRGLNQSFRQTEEQLRLLQSSSSPGTDVHDAYQDLINVTNAAAECLRHVAGHQALRFAEAERSKLA